MKNSFSFTKAFDRNIGWLTEWEQLALRGKRIAIAGMGGVGGVHLLTLARFGIGAFNISDFDSFDIVNFNRQIGANVETIGRSKIDVLAEMALAINPELNINYFQSGVTDDNIDNFLNEVDIFVDGFDFFEIDIRSKVYARAYERGIPALCAAPIGMGAGCLAFLPGKMSFEEYFRFDGKSDNERFLRFLIGLAPRGLHRAYLVEPSAIDLPAHKGPSTGASCQICAGITAVNAVKLLLRRGEVQAAPYHHHYDAYRNKLVVSCLPRGLNGPWQRTKLAIARRLYGAERQTNAASQVAVPHTIIEEIINYGRWAPSPRNAQPWRFNITSATGLAIDIDFTADTDREDALLSAGALLETLRIAASLYGLRFEWRNMNKVDGLRFVTRFDRDDQIRLDPLFSHIPTRSVDRRPYRLRSLTTDEKATLVEALGPAFSITWLETVASRWSLARLATQVSRYTFATTDKLAVFAAQFDWKRSRSPDAIPVATLGINSFARKMGLAICSHPRLASVPGIRQFAALRFETLPILASAAGFVLHSAESDHSDPAIITAGMALQRFWLTAARLGLVLQPLQRLIHFVRSVKATPHFAEAFRAIIGTSETPVFIGRIGEPRGDHLAARATRLDLDRLIPERPVTDLAPPQIQAVLPVV